VGEWSLHGCLPLSSLSLARLVINEHLTSHNAQCTHPNKDCRHFMLSNTTHVRSWKWEVVVVDLLLRRGDININARESRFRRTAPLRAANNGYEGVVKLLLGREDIHPTTPDTQHGMTPFLWPAKRQHTRGVYV